MRDRIVATLVTAAVSALAYIAYRHPKSYARMYLTLMIIAFMGQMVWTVYWLGYSAGFGESSIGYLTLNSGILNYPKRADSPVWGWILPAGIMVYLSILKFLPQILDLPIEDKKKSKPKQKVNCKDLDA